MEKISVDGEVLVSPKKYMKSQIAILNQYVSLLTLPKYQEIMNKVDAIHFVVTKADLLGDTHEERIKKARELLLSKYVGLAEQLKAYCRKTKRINYSLGGEPLLFTFSLGKFYLGDVFDYDPEDSFAFIESLPIRKPRPALGLLDMIREKLEHWLND